MSPKKRKRKHKQKRSQVLNQATQQVSTIGNKMQKVGWLMLFIVTIPVTGLYLFDLIGGVIGAVIGMIGLMVMSSKSKRHQSKD